MLEKFSNEHYMLIGGGFAVFSVLTLFILCFRKSKSTTKKMIFLVLLANLVMFCLRPLFPPSSSVGIEDQTFPRLLHYLTFESVCAICTWVFPFVLLFGGKTMKDFFVYVATLASLVAIFFPAIEGDMLFEYDTIRFFFMHFTLLFMPVAMLLCGLHKMEWKNFWKVPFVLLLVLGITFLNEVILTVTGLNGYTFKELFDRNVHNVALVYGPTVELEKIVWLLDGLTPEFLRTALYDIPEIGLRAGSEFYWPLVWLIVPILVVLLPLFLVMGIVLNLGGFFYDVRYFWYMIMGKFEKVEKLERSRKLTKLKQRR
jgi:uncharacterized membrane protein YwaF